MLFRSERGIGRGEVAEGQFDAPLIVAFIAPCLLVILGVHVYFDNLAYTIAAGVSMLFFGITLFRVEWGIYLLTIATMLAPEVNAGAVGVVAQRTLSIRYDDVLIVVIFIGVTLKQAYKGEARLWLPNPVNWPICLYYGICLISTLLALRLSLPAWDSRTAGFVLLKMLEFYMVFWMVGNAIESRHQIRKQIIVYFAVAAVVSLYSIRSIEVMNRVSAPFDVGGSEPNTLGGYLVLGMCLATGLFLEARRKRTRIVLLCMFALSFYPFLFTLSRASYLGLIAGGITLAVIRRSYVLLAVMAVVLVFSGSLMPDAVRERVNYTFQEGSGVPMSAFGNDLGFEVDKSTYERIYVWHKVRFNLQFWPWFGGGVEWDRVLDSQYARVLIETGIFGFLAFLFLQFRLLRTMYETHAWSRDPLVRGLGLGLTAAVIALIVHSFGTISFLIIRIMEPFWVLAALAVVGRELAIREHWRAYAAKVEAARREAAAEEESAQGPHPGRAVTPA